MPNRARQPLLPSLAMAAAALLTVTVTALSGCGRSPMERPAKNVILFIGDGMGVTTVTAARIFDGQSQGLSGEEHWLAFERFPNVALVKTYNTNQQVPDSAGTATAMVSGQKTRAGVVNVAAEVQRRDCEGALANPLRHIGEIAQERGLAVGFVTTTRVTHATPAVLYAHSPERDWEADWPIPPVDWQHGCRDIAYQLLNPASGRGVDIAMGGGSREFYGSDKGGRRKNPQEDLVSEWLSRDSNRRYIQSAEQLQTLTPGEQVLGLFAASHMTFVAARQSDSQEPTLAEMTSAAIDLLQASSDGYFLMVEGGRIDHAHHDGKPGYALLEVQAFNQAVEVALAKADLDDTLILVTADHSHVLTMSGYPTRGNPILGLVVGNDKSGEAKTAPNLAADGQPYATLGYANGPGAVTQLPRPAPETGIAAVAQALVPLSSVGIDGSLSDDETHSGEDVALYSIGPGAERVRGVMEQSQIFTIMMDAFGWSESP